MKPPNEIVGAVGLALQLRNGQVRAIAKCGVVNWDTVDTALSTIRRVKIPLRDAAKIWGYTTGTNMLRKHINEGNLEICNPGPRGKGSRHNPSLVTIGQMIALMTKLNHPAMGLR